MAKKSKVNKSQAIRDYLKTNRKAMPKDVVEALKAKGIKVSPQMVSTVKFNMQKKKGKRRAAGRRASNGRPETVSLSSLLDAKKFVQTVGSFEKAKAALDSYAKLT
jgi:hypothetical protein